MKAKNTKQKTINWLFAFLFAFILGFSAILGVSNVGFASTSGSLSVSGLTASDSGNATWTLNGTEITGDVTGKAATTGCNATEASSQNGTLTLKNTKGSTAKISFSYTLTLNGGSAQIAGTSVTSNGSYGPADLANNGTVTVKITSDVGAKTTSIKLTAISLVVEQQVTGTFLPASSGGSYTVNGNTITSQTSISQLSTTPFVLNATPASGYQFYGWHVHSSSSGIDDVSIESSQATYNLQKDSNFYLKPEFMKTGTAVFKVGNSLYNSLTKANTAAVNGSSKKIILNADGTLFEGSYEISSGVTLLIPFDSANTDYTTEPGTLDGSYTTPTVFRKLTMAAGASINVYGAISLPSKVSAKGQTNGNNGQPSGPSGRIYMQSGSTITLQNNAKLYCWGFIYGDGLIDAKSGSTVYECFQIKNFRGGTCTSNMLNNSQKVFPFNQYYVQNVECSLKFNYGSKEILFTCVTMTLVGVTNSSFTFIGSTDGLFRLTSGYFIKRYDPSTDRLIVEAYGAQLNLSSITVTVYKQVKSSDYVLPINSNITISLKDNTTVTTTQDLCFFPGCVFNIDSTSTFNINNSKNIYVYDSADWNDSTNFYVVGYTASNGTATKRTTNSLVDAEFDLNGTIDVANGAHFYTTTSGAFIHSSQKSGEITFASVSTNSTTYQVSSTSPDYYSMNVVNAILTNGDGTHYSDDVVPGEVIGYDATLDKWGKTAQADRTIHVNFADHDNPSNTYSTSYEYPSQSFTFPTQTQAGVVDSHGYKLRKWIDSNNVVYDPGQVYEGELDDNCTLYAYYGGWLTDSDLVTSYTYRTSDTAPTYPYGVATVEKLNDESNTETYLFLANGILSDETGVVLNTNDSKYYYFEIGVLVKNAGLIFIDTTGNNLPDSYYFIDSNGCALTSTTMYIDENSYELAANYYRFGANGKMVSEDGELVHIDTSNQNKITDSQGNLPISNARGLFALQNTIGGTTHLIYIDADGKAIVGCTFYVNDEFINNYQVDGVAITKGLYYFDANGYMYDATYTLIEGTLSSTNIVTGGGV